jgi:DNA-directed RNA polymerase sigma subunit (sigma70/sigma32)
MDEKELALYLDEVRRAPQVRSSAEVELWRVVERGGSEAKLARDRLIEANLRLGVAVAKKYIGRGLPLGDLIEASNMGLLRAVERFDHRQGVPFSGYAVWWMRRDIEGALERARAQSRE